MVIQMAIEKVGEIIQMARTKGGNMIDFSVLFGAAEVIHIKCSGKLADKIELLAHPDGLKGKLSHRPVYLKIE